MVIIYLLAITVHIIGRFSAIEMQVWRTLPEDLLYQS